MITFYGTEVYIKRSYRLNIVHNIILMHVDSRFVSIAGSHKLRWVPAINGHTVLVNDNIESHWSRLVA